MCSSGNFRNFFRLSLVRDRGNPQVCFFSTRYHWIELTRVSVRSIFCCLHQRIDNNIMISRHCGRLLVSQECCHSIIIMIIVLIINLCRDLCFIHGRRSVSKLPRVQDQGFLKEFLELHNPCPPSPPLLFPSPPFPPSFHSPPFSLALTLPFSPTPSLPFPFPLPGAHSLIQLGDLERCKLPQRVRAESGHQTACGAY